MEKVLFDKKKKKKSQVSPLAWNIMNVLILNFFILQKGRYKLRW